MIDVAIIGAGVNGAALAHALHQQGQKVCVFESNAIAAGGSGAAGAFINPKVTKAGPLKELIDEAYLFSLNYYQQHFPEHTTSAPLLHIAKDSAANEKVNYFKEHTPFKCLNPQNQDIGLTSLAKEFAQVLLQDNAVLEAKEVCESMLEGIELIKLDVTVPVRKEGAWEINGMRCQKIVLCIGASESVFEQEFIALRRIFGQRCEVQTSTHMPLNLHHKVSVSTTKKNGCVAIGASHYLNKNDIPNDVDGARGLISLACESVALKDVKIIKTLTGLRSGSNDYLPLLGPLVDVKQSLKMDSSALKGNKKAQLVYIPDVYMINGVGGYGFVLAPFLAKIMSEYLLHGKDLPTYLKPERFYYRHMKKRGA